MLTPSHVTPEEAAAVPVAAVTALQGLRDRGGLRARQNVLINAASGGVGTFAVVAAAPTVVAPFLANPTRGDMEFLRELLGRCGR